ncbi:MAG: hypothetical protein ABIH74_06450 [Candidatus Omnitrophota bacterium]
MRRSFCATLVMSLVVMMFLSSGAVLAARGDAEDPFFSCKRFALDRAVTDRIPAAGNVRLNIKKFMIVFSAGMNEFSAGDMKKAGKRFFQAQEIWPEYFGTDFLLALVYERRGDHDTAARYYKGYLNKLRNFHAGEYRISGPIIWGISSSGVDEYGDAQERVRERLARQGIRLEKVVPPFRFPKFFRLGLLTVFMLGVYAAVRRWLWPYIVKQRRLRNPPEGFWVCAHCGADNPVLGKECTECGRPRA